MLSQALRYFHTLRHLRPVQTLGRVLPELDKRTGHRLTALRMPCTPAGLSAGLRPRADFPLHSPGNSAEKIERGSFCFLNEERELGRPIDWSAPGAAFLWRYNLHYFDWLHLLDDEAQAAACREWVAANPLGRSLGWQAYPTSRRIVAWIRAGRDEEDLLASLHEQAAFLHRNVETYLLNNHVLENARALILAGCWFGDQGEAPRWLAKGAELLREHGAEQVLTDGGHFERSVMYHSLMLETWLDVLNVLPPEHPDAGAWSETAAAMMDFLASLLHPDGGIALFNDAAHGIAPSPEGLLAYGRELLGHEPRIRDEFPDSGYFVHRGPEVFLAMDAGPVGPDVSPGHGHADVFSYELSLAGRRIVVDRGTHEYAAGAMRDADRATRSHNTVCIDGRDQVECWASFRIARRDAPRDVRFVSGEGRSRLEGVFAGWGRLLGDGLEHRRVLAADDAARCLTVEDRVSGRGSHRVESLVHLHPEASAEIDDRTVTVRREELTCRIEVPEGAAPILEPNLHCPEFGRALPGTAVVLRHEGPLPVTLSYRILY